MLVKTRQRQVGSTAKAAQVLRDILAVENEIDQDKEHFWVIGLDTGQRIKYVELVTLGVLDSSLVHPREVFRMAISQGVARLLIGHNHPSGAVIPSGEDQRVTDRLVRAGEVLGIEVLDHIIIGKSGEATYTSFKEDRLM